MTTQTQRWPGFGYVQVPGLANRLIARYLRAQRKNMRAFFAAQGLTDLFLRMESIRKSNKGMLAKNRDFQKVLDDYSKLVSPGTATSPAGEADDQQGGERAVGVPGEGHLSVASGTRSDASEGVSGLEEQSDAGAVIEE